MIVGHTSVIKENIDMATVLCVGQSNPVTPAQFMFMELQLPGVVNHGH